jgi:hypothetical protein
LIDDELGEYSQLPPCIFARNPDTGMAKWVYQMTPHDEWDYDGVNEMILTDQQIGGQTRKLLDALRPQRARLHHSSFPTFGFTMTDFRRFRPRNRT